MAMTEKKRAFVTAYLKTCINGIYNATQAAKDIGSTEKGARMFGYRMLQDADVRAELDKILHREQDRIMMTKERVLAELTRIATVDISQAYDEQGNLKAFKDIPEDVRRAIAGVDVDELWELDDEGHKVQVGWTKKLKFWDKNRALELIGKHFKMYTDKVELNVKTDLADKLAKARKRVGNDPK